jgi:hypothetical protein
MADKPEEGSRKTVEDVPFEKVHGFGTVDLDDDNHQLSRPADPNSSDAMDLISGAAVRPPQVKDDGIKRLLVEQSQRRLSSRRRRILALNLFQKKKKVPDGRFVVKNQNLSSKRGR